MIVFLVMGSSILDPEFGTEYVIVTARDREFAKSKASQYLRTNPDNYTVTPLTPTGAKVHLDITIN